MAGDGFCLLNLHLDTRWNGWFPDARRPFVLVFVMPYLQTTSSKARTSGSRGTASNAKSLKDALTATLITKMRTKFAVRAPHLIPIAPSDTISYNDARAPAAACFHGRERIRGSSRALSRANARACPSQSFNDIVSIPDSLCYCLCVSVLCARCAPNVSIRRSLPIHPTHHCDWNMQYACCPCRCSCRTSPRT